MSATVESTRRSRDAGPHGRSEPPCVSVVMCTNNRGEWLAAAIRSVLAQDPATPPFELLVVDNNSTDGTRETVERLASADDRLECLFEAQQGLSFARNAGIRRARAPIVAFTDDDVRVDAGWIRAIIRAFEEHGEADVVGGRVLPLWPSGPPEWLTREHWAPLALADHGEQSFTIDLERTICLVGANVACRRSVFDAIGLFETTLQRVKHGIGSLEDHEFLLRVLRTGRTGLYDPRIVVHAEIQPDRLERTYHRRWHTGHGHFHALLRSEQIENARARLLGVPIHLYRQAAGDAVAWMAARLSGGSSRAFHHELRLRFFGGFFRTRTQEFLRWRRRERSPMPWTLHPAVIPGESIVPHSDAGTGQGRG
jgi:glycosyltransferase involved in cell wall biosynthesis